MKRSSSIRIQHPTSVSSIEHRASKYRTPMGTLPAKYHDFILTRVLCAVLTASLIGSACTTPDPNDPEIVAAVTEARNLGLAYLEENRLDEAESQFRRILDLAPNDASAHANLGIVFLRSGRFEQAEEALRTASELDPSDPSIALSLADVYDQLEQPARAREVVDRMAADSSDHVPTLYRRAQLYAQTDSAASYMGEVVARAPANIVPRLFYVEALIRRSDAGAALDQLNQARLQVPDLPREAEPHLEEALIALQNDDLPAAARSTRIFHNLMKVTPFYQTGIRLLGIRTDALAGVPVISEPAGLTQSAFFQEGEDADILGQMRFTPASDNAQLSGIVPAGDEATALALVDFNSDGETDVFVASWNADSENSTFHLFSNQFGRFADATAASGLRPGTTAARYALFSDYDNDTFPDLFLVNDGPNQLFRNTGSGQFEDVSAAAGVNAPGGQKAVFADIDHDGDLDLLIAAAGPNRVYRNNMDGTFTEMAVSMGLAGGDESTSDVDFGDFDDDGDLDLLFTGDGGAQLFSNQRQGRFELVGENAGLRSGPATASAAGDYNNDGFLDLAVAGSDGVRFFLNRGEFRFEADTGNNDASIRALSADDVEFLDVDNDGYLDVFLAEASSRVLHNDGSGAFDDVTAQLMEEDSFSARRITVADYNLDRDLDLFLEGADNILLLRNDGGHLNRSLSVQARGLLANSSKNNYYGIGAKVEVRAGDLYQMRVVTSPVTYFGIGKRLKADVVRIVFTNGVPQNIFRPGTDQDIIEQQILKGSCPFLYTWNGSEYVFATDILWRSALGMPLGIQGGETAYAPASPAEDYIKIPDNLLAVRDGRYRLQITGELWETPFFDEVALVAVDHRDSVSLWVDERFGPPRADPLHFVRRVIPFHSAVDGQGRDMLPALRAQDSSYTGPLVLTPYQGLVEAHDLILDPGPDVDPEEAVLYLKGWIFPSDASINVALAQSDRFVPMPPQVQVRDNEGRWQTVIDNMGFPMGKNKAVRVDLRGRFLSDDRRVRIRTNMQIYWDVAFFAEESDAASLRRSHLHPTSAELYYRGFSRMYRTSPFGPHLYDFGDVDERPRWRDLEGRYTRYGNVTPLLQSTDDQYVIMNAGDAIELTFDADRLPVLPAGWTRSFVLYSNGWLKDGDLNTANGQTVEPLPFVGMSTYPYGPDERYPMTEANGRYLETYNTRVVTQQAFRDAVKAGFKRRIGD